MCVFGTKVDVHAKQIFSCRHESKKKMHDFTVLNVTCPLHQLHVTADITWPRTPVDVQPRGIGPSFPGSCPFDMQIRPKPSLNPHPDAPEPCLL